MIQVYAKEICDFLMKIPEVKSCNIYGSLCKGNFDEYSGCYGYGESLLGC